RAERVGSAGDRELSTVRVAVAALACRVGAAESARVAAPATDGAVAAVQRKADGRLFVIEPRALPGQRRVAARACAEWLVGAIAVVTRGAHERRAGEPERRMARQARGGLMLAGQPGGRERMRVRHLLPPRDVVTGLAPARGAAVRLRVA